ncbi:MAG: CoB--CoM heterodisulfide reductase iron-sulfur subunit B family protein [Sphaerochaetaceae bacterium]|nr:CoB--CoM heterodisulfide reductase iron-sulfur subunit B family protein [Sphaerochaetaceae bacterium]
MVYSYYPGCTLKNTAKELDECGRISAEALGFTLEEITDWQCCGGQYTSGKDEIVTKLSSVRALDDAKKSEQDLVTLCSACYNVIKQTNNAMIEDSDMQMKVNNYLKLDEPYKGETSVYHFLEVLRDKVGFDKVKEAVKAPLKGKKVGAYYGCLLLRPGKVLQFDDPENPKIMEDFIKALGGTPVIYNMRNECCGGYTILEDTDAAGRNTSKILLNAEDMGADFLITACPLCQYNLMQNSLSEKTPIYYFTELLAHALGLREKECFK